MSDPVRLRVISSKPLPPRRPVRLWPLAAGIAAHFALRTLLDPWLNAPSDAKLLGAIAILTVPLLWGVIVTAKTFRPPPSPG